MDVTRTQYNPRPSSIRPYLYPSCIVKYRLRWFYLTCLLVAAVGTGCGEDPCRDALPDASGTGGPASLTIRITGQAGTPGRKSEPVACVDLLIVPPQSYADTLAYARVDARSGQATITGLPAAAVDLIVDRKGYFPVKLTDLVLTHGENLLDDRVLMYRSSADILIPGQMAFVLKPGALLAQVDAAYKYYDGVRMRPAPRSFELDIPWQGQRYHTMTLTETICRNLVRSPYVANARPLARLSSVIPGL